MSEDWVKKVHSGKSRVRRARIFRTYAKVEACFSGLRETTISPSPVPTVAISLLARFRPLFGSPILSMMVWSSAGGIIPRIASSTRVKIRSVSSMRVPAGVRTCSRNDPASTWEKSSPRAGTRAR